MGAWWLRDFAVSVDCPPVSSRSMMAFPAILAVVLSANAANAAEAALPNWQKSYVARLDQKGRFDVTITEPTRSRGTLRIVFCLEKGVVTGDGRTRGISGAVEIPYAGSPTGYRRSN